MSLKFQIVTFLLISSAVGLYGQKSKKLFKSDSILELTIELPLKKVINDTEDRNGHEAKLSYTLADGSQMDHVIKVKVRGKTRAMKRTCRFPPLELSFNKKDLANSIFKGQKKLKLVTHCKNSKIFEDYIQKEYLVYKLYQNISPYSFKVRLCKITYVDNNSPGKPAIHFGFLIERIKDVAKRNEMTVFKDSIRNQDALNKDNLDKLTLFQLLIGNLDWSIPRRHNMKLMKADKGSLPVAVPYDFDYSGMVDTPYAVPPANFDIPNVKTRVFRGLCRNNGYGETVEFYKGIKADLSDEIENASFLSDKSRKSMLAYIDSFYELLENPNYVEQNINQGCWAKHRHRYEY